MTCLLCLVDSRVFLLSTKTKPTDEALDSDLLPSRVPLTSPTYEDWILLLSPLFGAGAGSNLAGILPGTSGFVLGVLVAALGKSLAGIGSDVKSYEDWWLFLLTFAGLVLTGFTGNGQFALGGSIIGF